MNRLQELRDRAGLSQAELAQVAGCSRQAISMWEAGRRRPGLDIGLVIAKALGVDPQYIWPPEPVAPDNEPAPAEVRA